MSVLVLRAQRAFLFRAKVGGSASAAPSSLLCVSAVFYVAVCDGRLECFGCPGCVSVLGVLGMFCVFFVSVCFYVFLVLCLC